MACEEYRFIGVFCVHRLPASAPRFFLGLRRHKAGNADRGYTRLQTTRLSASARPSRNYSCHRRFPGWRCRKVLRAITSVTPLNIACDVVAQTRPPKVPVDEFIRFVLPGMAMDWCVVVLLQDVVAYLLVPWNVDSTIVEHQTITFFPFFPS